MIIIKCDATDCENNFDGEKDCEWNNDGICTCSGTAPCIEYE